MDYNSKDNKILLIIPAYNEGMNIEATVKDIQENASDFDYVIIYYDKNSKLF